MKDLLEKYTTRESRFLVFDNTLVHYRDEGEGFPILLLHGAFSSLHTYNGWVKELKPHYRLIRLDLPGFGLTGPNSTNPHTMEMYQRCLTTILDRLKVEKCHIVGSSLGGWLSWEFTHSNPERIEKMLLIGSAGFLDQRNIPLPFRMARTPFLNKVARYAIKKTVLEQFVRQVYQDQEKVTPALIDRYFDLFTREGNPEVFFEMANAKFREDTHKLNEIFHPTLIMWGKNDRWIPVENAYRFHRKLPNSQILLYEEVGHVPMEENPIQTAADAHAFFSENALPLAEKKAKKRKLTSTSFEN